MAELTVDDLHLRYGDTPILNGVALTLERGQVVSVELTEPPSMFSQPVGRVV